MRKKTKTPIVTGDKVLNSLYSAVIKYVEKRGGTAVVIGGVELFEDSPAKFNYGILVRVTGKKPTFSTTTKVTKK